MKKAEMLLFIILLTVGLIHIIFLFSFFEKEPETNHYAIGYNRPEPDIGMIRVVPLGGRQIRSVLQK